MLATQVVYVIGSSESPVKIGIATSIADRLCNLQVGNPDLLVCHHFVRVSAARALEVERAAHRAFSDRHRLGEWFNVDWREAARLLDDLAAIENTTEPEVDLFAVLRSQYGMKADGRDAVWDYLDRQDRGDAYIHHANGYILKRLGTASYAAFSLVVAQQKQISGLKGDEVSAAMSALARAINALSTFRLKYQRAVALADISREFTATRMRA